MITFETVQLKALEKDFEKLAAIGLNAVGKEMDQSVRELTSYAKNGAKCTLAKEGSQLIGYIVYGPVSIFLGLDKLVETLPYLKAKNVVKAQTACHVHILKEYWKTGLQLALSQEMAKAMLSDGTSHLFLSGYATDELATYSLTRPGSTVFEGLFDINNRPVGVRDLAEYLQKTL